MDVPALRGELDKLAKAIVEEATGQAVRSVTEATHKDTSFAEKLDAFKVLTAYYGLLLKHKDKSGDDPEESNFTNFTTSFEVDQENADGGATVRSRTGRN